MVVNLNYHFSEYSLTRLEVRKLPGPCAYRATAVIDSMGEVYLVFASGQSPEGALDGLFMAVPDVSRWRRASKEKPGCSSS